MNRRTKIVCTLGPAVDSQEAIERLIVGGMNVARLNCSHGDWETKKRWIEWIRRASQSIAPVAILADLQGPKFRIGVLPDLGLEMRVGTQVTMGHASTATIPLFDDAIWATIREGDRILFADGNVGVRVLDRKPDLATVEVESGGILKSRQGITVVDRGFTVSCMTDKDEDDLREAIGAGVDFIALSYVRTGDDVTELRQRIDLFDPEIKTVAKVETREAVDDIDAIIEASDAVMVARGDMGLQMPLDDVPIAQKQIIRRCNELGKAVITATQMLESMIVNPRPTRAEASDVANAILDGTDAVMLSGETAAGDYPIEAVRTMARIAEKAEAIIDHRRYWTVSLSQLGSSTEAIASSAVHLSHALGANAVLTTSTSGSTARMVSKFRPMIPIYCATSNERTWRQLALTWGVESALVRRPESTDSSIADAVEAFVELDRLEAGDDVVVTAGVPAGVPGNTNLILHQKVEAVSNLT